MSKKQTSLLFISMLAVSGFVVAAPSSVIAAKSKSEQLPDLQCDRTHCDFVALGNRPTVPLPPAVANPNPYVVGPPAGQRYSWRGAGYPACQTINTATIPTAINPYEYLKADTIPVPLGSTHADLVTITEINLSGGSTGSGGVVGFLQLRRSGTSPWVNSATGYLYTVVANSPSLYGAASLRGLENLADLPNGSGVPEAIDVRLGVFVVVAGGFSPGYNQVCRGKLDVTF